MGTEVEFEEFMDGVAKGIKLKEILTLEEIEEQERLKNIKADGRKGKRLF